jgi:hypothetical protein
MIFFCLLAPFFGKGQGIQFGRLGGGLESNGYMTGVRSMFYDTIDKKLYVSGQFKTAENKIVWGAAVWNGTMWDSLQGGFTQYPHQLTGPGTPSEFAWKIIRYKNNIYFGGGGIAWINGKNQYNFGKWNGTSWEFPLPYPSPANVSINDMLVYNDTLYACGTFTNFGSIKCKYVAKYDGQKWYPVGDFSKFHLVGHDPAQMNAISFYNGEIYVGGAFDDTSGTPRNIAKFDGVRWVNVGSGIKQGGIAWVQSLEQFNNKLYIAGYFSRTAEVPGESFVAWNGTTFEDLNSDILSGTFRNLINRKGKLFVLAGFYSNATKAGIKIITPEKQCLINGLESTFTNSLNYSLDCMEIINDSLIVGGLFKYLDTISANNIGVITNYQSDALCAYTGLKLNYFRDDAVKIFPNPVKENLTVEFETAQKNNVQLTISNSFGQPVYSSDHLGLKHEVDLSFLPSGFYLLKIEGVNGQKVFKIIKQ